MQRKRKLRIIGTGEHLIDTIYIDNAALAHVQAFETMLKKPHAIGGKAYFLSQDQPISIREFIDQLLNTAGLPPVRKTMSPRLALFAGWLLPKVYKLFRVKKEPPLSLFVVKHLLNAHWYDISAAKRDFGYVPFISIEEGMRRLKEWVEENLPSR
jgi:nucleoside-diphosphate-sugar epimerase